MLQIRSSNDTSPTAAAKQQQQLYMTGQAMHILHALTAEEPYPWFDPPSAAATPIKLPAASTAAAATAAGNGATGGSGGDGSSLGKDDSWGSGSSGGSSSGGGGVKNAESGCDGGGEDVEGGGAVGGVGRVQTVVMRQPSNAHIPKSGPDALLWRRLFELSRYEAVCA